MEKVRYMKDGGSDVKGWRGAVCGGEVQGSGRPRPCYPHVALLFQLAGNTANQWMNGQGGRMCAPPPPEGQLSGLQGF